MVITLAAFAWSFGWGINRAVYNNFLSAELGITAQQLGIVEGVRELPGLLTIVLSAITSFIAPPLLAGCCNALMGLGLMLYAGTSGFSQLVAFTLLFSTGFHLMYPVQNALILGLSEQGRKGTRLGQVEGIMALAMLLAMGSVVLLSTWISLRGFYLVAGLCVLPGAALMLALPRDRVGTVRPRFRFRRRYITYYMLTLLNGARRHIFLTFAVWNLVRVFDVPVGRVALLLTVAQALSIYARPLLGRVIDRVGERTVLVVCYAAISLVFVGYATVSWLPLLYILFALDAVLRFEMAATTYLDKIAVSEEVAPTLAAGSTVNHVTGVLVPVLGGWLWEAVSPAATFGAGAAMALIGLAYCLWLPLRPVAPDTGVDRGGAHATGSGGAVGGRRTGSGRR